MLGISQAAALNESLRLASQDTSLGTMLQTAVFVRNQDPESYQQEAQKIKADPYYTPKAFQQKADSEALVQELFKNMQAYEWKCEDLQIYKRWTHLGDGIVYESAKIYPLTAPVFAGLIGFEASKKKEVTKLEKKIEPAAHEFARRLRLTPEDLEALSKMPKEQATAQLRATIDAPMWENFIGDKHLPSDIKEKFLDIYHDYLQTLKHYSSPDHSSPVQADEKFVNNIYIAVRTKAEIQQIPAKWEKEITSLASGAEEMSKDIIALRDGIQFLQKGSEEQAKATRFFLDLQYKNLSTEEKLDGIERGLYPGKIKDKESLTLLRKWEKLEKKFTDYAGYALIGVELGRQLGIKLPRNLEKGVVGAQHTFQLVMGISTGNFGQITQALGGLCGLFRGTGPDINGIRHQEIMNALSLVIEGQQQIMSALETIQMQLIQLYELNVALAHTIQQIGTLLIEQHAETMAALERIDRDILYNRELLMQMHLDHLKECKELTLARAEKEYQCNNGLFATHTCAQRFFHDHFEEFKKTMQENLKLFQTNPIDARLKFQGAYSHERDAQEIPGNNRYFENKIWASSYQYYNSQLTEQQRIDIFRQLFEPAIYVGSLDRFMQATWTAGDQLLRFGRAQTLGVESFCFSGFSHLIAPKIVLEAGEFTIDFHRYYPLIKNLNTGELYTIDELLQTQQKINEGHKKTGLKILKRIFSFTNLAIAQQHLLSGGPLIPIFYSNFFENLDSYLQTMHDPETPAEQKTNLQNQVEVAVNLLAYNPIFARNMLLYALRKKLDIQEDGPHKRTQCLKYRIAYNHTVDSTALESLFPGWQFKPLKSSQYGKEHGWALDLPFTTSKRDEKKVLVELVHPSDLFFGRLEYTLDLHQLTQLRRTLIQEIVNYQFMSQIAHKEDLRNSLAENIFLYS